MNKLWSKITVSLKAFFMLAMLVSPTFSFAAGTEILPPSAENQNISWAKAGRFIESLGNLPVEVADKARQAAEEIQINGFVIVPDYYLRDFNFKKIQPQLRAMSNDEKKNTAWRADINSFASYGLRYEGVTRIDDVSITRSFSTINGKLVTLTETNFSINNGGVLLPKEMVNTMVNGLPAILTTQITKQDLMKTNLGWANDSVHFLLEMEMDPKGTSVSSNDLIYIASSIP